MRTQGGGTQGTVSFAGGKKWGHRDDNVTERVFTVPATKNELGFSLTFSRAHAEWSVSVQRSSVLRLQR